MSTSVILVSGGVGSRMQAALPKQYLHLQGKPIALFSFELFISMEEIDELVVVCAPEYQHLFHEAYISSGKKIPLTFALPGERRQDSVYNGLQKVSREAKLICTHDSARPLANEEMIKKVLESAKYHGAATIGMPLKYTIKECNKEAFVTKTPDRSVLWEIQTPQAMQAHLLREGFAYALKHNVTVTDDTSLIELLQHPVKLVEGCYSNLKITTPEDLPIAEWWLARKKLF